MGFEDLKSRRPNNQWQLLERLAENNGEISWERFAAKNSGISKTGQDFGHEFDEEKDTQQNKGYPADYCAAAWSGGKFAYFDRRRDPHNCVAI